ARGYPSEGHPACRDVRKTRRPRCSSGRIANASDRRQHPGNYLTGNRETGMLRGQPIRTRFGRFHQESTALLVMLLVLGLVTLRWLSGAPVEPPKPWDGAGTLLSALLYFLGLV